MPRLDADTFRAVRDYHGLRYSHWPAPAREDRERATVRQLKTLSPERQALYREQVAEFMAKNQHLLDQIEEARKQIQANQRTEALLQMPEERRDALLRKYGGNVNAVLDAVHGRHSQ